MPYLSAKTSDDTITLVASAAATATGTGSITARLPAFVHGVVFCLDVTAAATATGDTLDVLVQTRIGANWVDVVAFTQVLGDGGAKRYYAKISATEAQDDFESASGLSAGAVRNLIGDEWRARWAITDADTEDVSFTFSVTACPM